jgi:NADH-quinone oxidoreductase subunit F
MVIPAVGQVPDLSFLPPDFQLERVAWGALKVNPDTLQTNIPWIFAGGDFATGPSMAIFAIAAGQRAALSIDRYFRGLKEPLIIRDEQYFLRPEPPPDPESLDRIRPRFDMPRVRPEERITGFDEFEKGFGEKEARMEASRCLRCDLERIRDMHVEDW